jgi:signal transduction histidine kinase
LLAFLLLLGPAPSDAQPAVRQVLVLQSFDRGNVPVDQLTSNFRVELDQRAEASVNVVQVVVGPTGFVDRPKPDLIVTVVLNAMDAMAGTPPTRRRLTISSVVRAAAVEVSVRDNGTGVPPDLIDRLFTPFVTTKPNGLGIGLTIAGTILNAHAGSVAARNNPDGGATFVVTLFRGETPRIQSGSSDAA